MRWVSVCWLVFVGALAGCASGEPPDILGLSDQVAVVGQPFVLELEGVDPDGDNLLYKVDADVSLEGNATITQTPAGMGVFRWTPIASDVGVHSFDFTAWDGSHDTTVTIQIEVRSASNGRPTFR